MIKDPLKWGFFFTSIGYKMEFIGWLGNILLSVSGLPQAYLSIKTKSAAGISWGMLVCWYFGEWFALVYGMYLQKGPLVLNYVLNIVFITVIIYYKIFGE
jgi:uncharacterized protein with PQ loop repeat